ncbi:MAG: prolipoprotein diacylglyceryl transferase [Anaerolineales bacterium]|nr:prolipoprotein diacylglyceryl transferase [Anaerolineales bacterium]
MSFDELGIRFGVVYVRYYGIILMSAALLIAWVGEVLARRKGYDPEIVWDMFLWVVVGAVVGARIWHILTPQQSMVDMGMDTVYYLTHPFDALNLTKGGLGFPGGVIGGAIAMIIYVRRNNLSFLVWGDIAVPGVAIGHAFGRLGNWINHEVYGRPTDLPWSVYIPPEYRITEYANEDRYHPLFLYEMLLNIVNFAILILLGQKYSAKLKDGDLILVYLLNYGLIRFFLEYVRLDYSPLAGTSLNVNQITMAVTAVGAVAILIWRHGLGDWIRARRTAKEPTTI